MKGEKKKGNVRCFCCCLVCGGDKGVKERERDARLEQYALGFWLGVRQWAEDGTDCLVEHSL